MLSKLIAIIVSLALALTVLAVPMEGTTGVSCEWTIASLYRYTPIPGQYADTPRQPSRSVTSTRSTADFASARTSLTSRAVRRYYIEERGQR